MLPIERQSYFPKHTGFSTKYFSNHPLKPSIWSLNLNLIAIVYCIPSASETKNVSLSSRNLKVKDIYLNRLLKSDVIEDVCLKCSKTNEETFVDWSLKGKLQEEMTFEMNL